MWGWYRAQFEIRFVHCILGFEPTGHYWFALATWMVEHDVTIVQVNPYAVKQTKEVEDNSQEKNDRKDPKVIANLVKNGKYSMPYLPEGVYADLRVLSRLRDQLTEDQVRAKNRLHRELKITFPEYKDAFGKIDGVFTLSVLAAAPTPQEIVKLGKEGICKVWKETGLKGRGYANAERIVEYATRSVGVVEGSEKRQRCIRVWAEELIRTTMELNEIQAELEETCKKIPNVENVLGIKGLGLSIVSGIIAEMGDIDRFDDAKEIQKISGLALIEMSSGKHKGQTKISHRGRKRLRYWLYQGAMSVVSHDEAFAQIHKYYTTRAENPLKKMQSIIAIGCKLLRIIFAILKKGIRYDPQKMLDDIVRPVQQEPAA